MPAGFVNVPFNDLAAAKAATTDATVAIMVEPVQGESGVHPADPDYLQGLREWCDKEGMLLIFDEIQTGMGRTGHFLGYEWYKVEPDVFTMAKGLAGGVPIGAFLAKGSAAEALGPGDHGSTFGGSPLACAAGVATVKTLLEQELPANAGKQGGYLAAKLAELRREFPVITEIRARGLMIAFDLSEDVAPKLVLGGLEQGLILNNTGPHTIRIVPPLILNRREVDEGIGLLRSALSALKGA
jgi:acetylornithine/N-succinyldiaminopimelate aminotransferase